MLLSLFTGKAEVYQSGALCGSPLVQGAELMKPVKSFMILNYGCEIIL